MLNYKCKINNNYKDKNQKELLINNKMTVLKPKNKFLK